MRPLRTTDFRLILILLATAFILPGCTGVLTSSQVKEVATFADAAKAYVAFPGAVIRSHGQLRASEKILQASTFTNGDAALRQVDDAVNIRHGLDQSATAADSALGVLNDYAALLVTLTADTYTNDLQGSAETLGSSIDSGIARYNDLRKTNLDSFGALVAAGVRGAGGIYIRHRQAEALKKAVISADPIIDAMISEVEKLLALYLSPDDLKDLKLTITGPGTPPETLNLIRNVATDLRDTYKRIADNSGGKQCVEAALLTADGLTSADNTIQLAVKALQAAETYRMAHRKLAENVTRRQWLRNSIDQVKALVVEVNAANKTKKKIEAQ